MRTEYEPKWLRPYDPAEHDTRVICGDPIAVAYDALDEWYTAQGISGHGVSLQEVVDCLWSHKHGNHMTSFEVRLRNGQYIPEIIPDELYKHVMDVLF